MRALALMSPAVPVCVVAGARCLIQFVRPAEQAPPYRPWLFRRDGETYEQYVVRLRHTCKNCGAFFDRHAAVGPHVKHCAGPDAEAGIWDEH